MAMTVAIIGYHTVGQNWWQRLSERVDQSMCMHAVEGASIRNRFSPPFTVIV